MMKTLFVLSTIIVILAGLIATVSLFGTALADKVTMDNDNVKQGGLGEYNSKDGRQVYSANDPSGQAHGQGTSFFAQNSELFGGVESLGKTTSYIASGICHSHDGSQCQ
jgi:hypothetical protein